MHYLKHVGNTWLLAHLFHPFLFSALFAVLGDTGYILVYIFVMSLLIGLVFSIPALLCVACVLPGILRLRLSLSIVLLIWALLLGIATLCAAYLAIETLWEWRFENEPMLYPVPALLALALSLVFRKRSFWRLHAATHHSYEPVH